ncbi:hypothetical protein FJZ31_22185 [Candidatus Poribacteria bacterium]|nr:hypothetical protein [Candidatus Poribacteria bacterium]
MSPRLNDLRLKEIDLRQFIRLGVEHIYHGAINRRRACLPLVRFGLTESPPWARHEYWGSPHMVGRFLDALAVSAPIIDLPDDEEADDGLRQLLFACLNNPTGFAFDTLPNPDGKRSAAMHHCREVLLALTGLIQWKNCGESRKLARQFVRTIEAATRETGTFPAPLLFEDGWAKNPPPAPSRGGENIEENFPNTHSGRLIGALVKYYRVTNDAVALDIAIRFAEHNIAQTFTSEGELTKLAGTHLHSTEGTVTAIIDLGIMTNESYYIDLGKRLYDVGLRPWRTSFGWAKESRNLAEGRGEANNTGDFIEAALLLGQAGYPNSGEFGYEYFADAERMMRNGLFASQIINTDWIPEYDGTPDTDDYIYSDAKSRARGAFVFTTPNDYHSYNTDLVGGAVQSLCEAWNVIFTKEQAGLHVNLLFSKASEEITMRSHLPEEGRLEIAVHQDYPLFIRRPQWLSRDTLQVLVNGQAHSPKFYRHEVFIQGLMPNDKVELIFPQTKRYTNEAAAGYDKPYQVEWLGDTIINISPQGKIARLY